MRLLIVFVIVFAPIDPASAWAGALETGGGPIPIGDCLSADDALALAGRGAEPRGDGSVIQATRFSDPMGGGGMNSFGKGVVNYVDLQPAATLLLDWNCGTATYDGHGGIDIGIPSFYHMDEGVPILCAAPGIVTYTHDGEFDRRTAQDPSAIANAVIVQHADGSLAYYWHMRKGSVAVAVSQPVATGDVLGMVGSSGTSTGPHLHFQVMSGGAIVDPFSGSCQPSALWWITQTPYIWTLPFELFGHGVTTSPLSWPTVLEWPPSNAHVPANNTIYSWIRARNIRSSDLMSWRLYANGVLWNASSWNPSGSYTDSWWYTSWSLPANPALYGAWRIEIYRNGELIAQQFFTYDATPNQPPDVDFATVLTAADTPAEGELSGADPDGSIAWFETMVPPANGTLTLFGGRRHRFRYAPNPGFVGVDEAWVRAQDDQATYGDPARIRFAVGTTLATRDPAVAAGDHLDAVRPNPVRGAAEIGYRLAAARPVALSLYSIAGRRVRRWDEGDRGAGSHILAWDGRDQNGRALPSGVYLLELAAGTARHTGRIVVTR